MRRCSLLLLILLGFGLCAPVRAAADDELLRGIVYYLVDDIPSARRFIDRHFQVNPNPQVHQGFLLILDDKTWDATRRFSSYLEINHRSAKALVGIALATRKAKNSNSLENLLRAVRLHPRFYAARVCLGWHFQQARNFAEARDNYQAALSGSGVADIKILLAGLYVRMGRPDMAEELVREEADRHPDNFYFNYMTALAMVNNGRIDQAGGYMTAALEINPDNRDLGILRARYLYRRNRLAEARSILSAMKAADFNEDYLKTYARVLIALKQARRARPMLYDLFRNLPWDEEVNRMLGKFHREFSPDTGSAGSHWARRALLAGADPDTVSRELAGGKPLAVPAGLPLFSVRLLLWPHEDHILVVGRRSSGEAERLMVIDPASLRISGVIAYRGRFLDFHQPRPGGDLFFSTAETEGEQTNLYALEALPRGMRALPLSPRPLPMPRLLLGTNSAGSLVYVTDQRLQRLAFESPFAITSQLGRKTPLYPQCPFPVLMLNRRTRRWTRLKSDQMLNGVPIPEWKRYRAVLSAREHSPAVAGLIEKGQGFDISSPEMVRIIPSADGRSLLMYLADLENAFQAVIFDARSGRTVRCDQTMFLGGKSFADVDVKGFSPAGGRILLVTRDRDREAILFNYRSRLYLRLGMGVMDVRVGPGWRDLYLLKERGNRTHAVDTILENVHLTPYIVRAMTDRRNLTRLRAVDALGRVEARTYDGERVWIDPEGKVTYRGVSLEGATHVQAPESGARAAFINGRLMIIPSPSE